LAVPPSVRDAYGVRVEAIGETVLGMSSGLDVLTFNRVVGLGMSTPATAKELDAIIGRYRDANVRRFFLQLSPAAQPLALLDWIRQRGFVPYNAWMKLYRRAEPYSDDVAAMDAPEHTVRVERAHHEDADTFGTIAATTFGMPPAAAQWLTTIVGRDGWHCYLAYDGATPIGVGAMFVMRDYAWLGIAGTLEAARRRGAQTALIRHRVNVAHAMGCKWVVVETAEETATRVVPSLHNLRRLGFTVAYPRVNYLCAVE